MRISDWSSDVCSSDLRFPSPRRGVVRMRAAGRAWRSPTGHIGSGHGGGAGVNMEWVIVLGVVALVGGYVIAIYNRLIGLGRRVDEAWSDIQVQMKRRHDLVPKLVETVKEFMTHERGILEAVTHARPVAMSSGGGPGQQARAESVLQGAARHSGVW